MSGTWVDALLGVVMILLVFVFYIYIPIKMAKARGRNALGWVVAFILISPMVGIVLLLAVGDSNEKLTRNILSHLQDPLF